MTDDRPDIPPPGQVGHNHPDTAKEAADSVRWSASHHREMALLFLFKMRDHGATGAELGNRLGMSTNNACARLLELRGDGCASDSPCLAERLVVDGKRVRRKLQGGQPGIVHVLNEDGRKAAEQILARMGGIWPMAMRDE